MRWVALLALLLVAPTAAAAQAFFGSPVPPAGPLQMTCTVVLTSSGFEDCRFTGRVAIATAARIAILGDATATFRLDDDTNSMQGGQGSCAATMCLFRLNYAVTGAAFVSFKVTGTPGAVAHLEIGSGPA